MVLVVGSERRCPLCDASTRLLFILSLAHVFLHLTLYFKTFRRETTEFRVFTTAKVLQHLGGSGGS